MTSGAVLTDRVAVDLGLDRALGRDCQLAARSRSSGCVRHGDG